MSETCTRCSATGATRVGRCLDCLDSVAREIAEELDRILRSVIGPDTEPEPAIRDLFEREAEP